MLERTGAKTRGPAPLEEIAPKHRTMLERRRGNRLVSAWKSARGDLEIPSLAALEAGTDAELLRHSMLLRVRAKGALTIERFGPPAPVFDRTASRKHADGPPVVTPLVVTWILSVGAAALRRRAPVVESDNVSIGRRVLHYRCAVVPVAENGSEVDALVGVLGYRWA